MQIADLHCHILPRLDDGPKHESESLELLKEEQQGGIQEIALTSHYDCEDIPLNEFLEKREDSYRSLRSFLKGSNFNENFISMKRAAEVRFSPNLYNIDLTPLCIEGTEFMLLELPHMRPPYLNETIFHIQSCGITPIIAHIERCQYIMDDLSILYNFVEKELIVQMNANTLLTNRHKTKNFLKLIKWNLVHILASDAHSMQRRPPNLPEAIRKVFDCLGEAAAENLCSASHLIFNGIRPEFDAAYCPKKMLWRWI